MLLLRNRQPSKLFRRFTGLYVCASLVSRHAIRYFASGVPSKGDNSSHRQNYSQIVLDLTDKADQLERFREIIRVPLENLQTQLQTKSIKAPYDLLNKVLDVQLKKLIEDLRSDIDQQVKDFHEQPGAARKVSDIQLKDFINPRITRFAQMLYKIHLNEISTSFLEIRQLSNKFELIEDILLKLLYKKYLTSTLTKVAPLDTTIDYSNPAQWFPEARKMQRKIVMHIGPTNSGKTYNSLKKLASSRSGYYAGPLRLLAREIYENFNSRGISCNLVTGEEIIPSIDESGKVSEISSGTIEMIPLQKKMDICIIDEIQMIADDKRGEAWTSALLGVQASEVHLCGEESALALIKRIIKLTGDELEVNRYERLGKLTVADQPIRDFKSMRQGDCVVAFSKRKILELKCEIESKTNYKVGVIYGMLPADLRSKIANGFNKGEYDVLVASDAVGMGLNLAIKRIIFSTTKKYNGIDVINLTTSMVKQIAGRAGRFSHDKEKAGGEVTALTNSDLKYVRKMIEEPNKDIEKACTWPTNDVWTTYVSKFSKGESVLNILLQFDRETRNKQNGLFNLTDLTARHEILELFMKNDVYKRMTIDDQLQLSIAPVNLAKFSSISRSVTFDFIQTIINSETKSLMDFDLLPLDLLRKEASTSIGDEEIIKNLERLEDSHKLVLLFLWLSQRWPTLFVDKESANDWKMLIEKRMNDELNHLRRLTKAKRFNKRAQGFGPSRKKNYAR